MKSKKFYSVDVKLSGYRNDSGKDAIVSMIVKAYNKREAKTLAGSDIINSMEFSVSKEKELTKLEESLNEGKI
jgi:hypothetical protein